MTQYLWLKLNTDSIEISILVFCLLNFAPIFFLHFLIRFLHISMENMKLIVLHIIWTNIGINHTINFALFFCFFQTQNSLLKEHVLRQQFLCPTFINKSFGISFKLWELEFSTADVHFVLWFSFFSVFIEANAL